MTQEAVSRIKSHFLRLGVEEILSNPAFNEEFLLRCRDDRFQDLVYWTSVLTEKKPVLALQALMKNTSSVLLGEENEFKKFSDKIDLDGEIYHFCVLSQNLPDPTKESVEECTHQELLNKAAAAIEVETGFLLAGLDTRAFYSGVGFKLADRAGWDQMARARTLRLLEMDVHLRDKKSEVLRGEVEKNINRGVQGIAHRDVFNPRTLSQPENAKFRVNFFTSIMMEMDEHYQKYSHRFAGVCRDDLEIALEKKIGVLANVVERFRGFDKNFNPQLLKLIDHGILQLFDANEKTFPAVPPPTSTRRHLTLIKTEKNFK